MNFKLTHLFIQSVLLLLLIYKPAIAEPLKKTANKSNAVITQDAMPDDGINQLVASNIKNKKEMGSDNGYITVSETRYKNLLNELKDTRHKQSIYVAQVTELKKSVFDLENKLTSLIEAYDLDDENKPSFWGETFPAWAGILLACVAVIVTVLGVLIAIMSFIGYKEVINKSEKKAEETTEKVAEEILGKQVEQGAFDKIINDNIEKIALRGTSFGHDLDETNTQKQV